MGDEQLRCQVRALRARGLSPKEIARALGVRPSVVAPVVRSIANEEAAGTPEPAIVGCWVSPGWSAGLSVDNDRRWPDRPGSGSAGSGLAGVLVAREQRRGRDTVSVCGWLVDTYCLGVKDAIGPRSLAHHQLPMFVEQFFAAFDGEPVQAPIELARGLVWGSLEYAGELGFEPARDFAPTVSHLGPSTAPSGIDFGHNGKPLYIQGPYDDVDRIMRTLARPASKDSFHFVVEAAI